MKILNLYSGIGGNRKNWDNIPGLNVTAVEYNESIASVYKSFFPGDNVIVDDAHEYLLKNYMNFDVIWTSPPCQSHSMMYQNLGVKSGQNKPIYPDMKLYQEIIFLKHNFEGIWIVENVQSYYKPLIAAQNIGRHLIWSNKIIKNKKFESLFLDKATITDLQDKLGFNLKPFKLHNKRQILRNCCLPALGEHILKSALDEIQPGQYIGNLFQGL